MSKILTIIGMVMIVAFVIIVIAIVLTKTIGEDDDKRFYDNENEL